MHSCARGSSNGTILILAYETHEELRRAFTQLRDQCEDWLRGQRQRECEAASAQVAVMAGAEAEECGEMVQRAGQEQLDEAAREWPEAVASR